MLVANDEERTLSNVERRAECQYEHDAVGEVDLRKRYYQRKSET
jgi:hypothetical protein